MRTHKIWAAEWPAQEDEITRLRGALEEIKDFTSGVNDDDPLSHVHGTCVNALNKEGKK